MKGNNKYIAPEFSLVELVDVIMASGDAAEDVVVSDKNWGGAE